MEGGRREGGWAVATVTHLPKGSPCGKPAGDAAVATPQLWGHPLHGSPIPSAQPSTPRGIACVDRRAEEREAGPGSRVFCLPGPWVRHLSRAQADSP